MAKFNEQFSKYACTGDTITTAIDGITYRATIKYDDDAGAPWDREEGHGPVSGWTRRNKTPGERVLVSDRGSHRYYDFAEACKTALRDGWGVEGGKLPGETAKTYAARAAERDYKVLRAWWADDWSYCGVVVTAKLDGAEIASASLWGVKLNYPDSDNARLTEVADELLVDARDEAAEWIKRNLTKA